MIDYYENDSEWRLFFGTSTYTVEPMRIFYYIFITNALWWMHDKNLKQMHVFKIHNIRKI